MFQMTSSKWWVVLGVGLSVGCGGTTDDGGSDTGVGGTSGSGASAGTGGRADASEPQEAPLQVLISWLPLDSPGTQFLGATSWRRADGREVPRGPTNECQTLEVGACTAQVCEGSEWLPGPSEARTYANVGTITAHFDTEGEAATADGVLTPDADGSYATVPLAGDWLVGAEPGTLSAPGAELPGFDLAVDVPLLLIVTAPEAPAGLLSHSRQSDLVLTWDRGAADTYLFSQAGSPDDGDPDHVYGLYCEFESSAGTGTIDASLLSRLPVGFVSTFYTVRRYTANPGPDRTEVFIAADVFESTKTKAFMVTLTE